MKASGSFGIDVFGLHIGKEMIIPMIIALPILIVCGLLWLCGKAIGGIVKMIRRLVSNPELPLPRGGFFFCFMIRLQVEALNVTIVPYLDYNHNYANCQVIKVTFW